MDTYGSPRSSLVTKYLHRGPEPTREETRYTSQSVPTCVRPRGYERGRVCGLWTGHERVGEVRGLSSTGTLQVPTPTTLNPEVVDVHPLFSVEPPEDPDPSSALSHLTCVHIHNHCHTCTRPGEILVGLRGEWIL